MTVLVAFVGDKAFKLGVRVFDVLRGKTASANTDVGWLGTELHCEYVRSFLCYAVRSLTSLGILPANFPLHSA